MGDIDRQGSWAHMLDTLLIISIGLIGAMVGSFLNVVIYRVPRGESIVLPASHCPACDAPIKPYDNIPVISYLMLRGKCRSCGVRISWRYPAVELLMGLLWALAASRFGLSVSLPAALYFISVLVAITFIDIDHQIIPNKIVFPSIAVGLVLLAFQGMGPLFAGSLVKGILPLATGATGFLIGGGLLLLVALAYPNGMGGGDVKLAAFMGVILNFYVLIALFGAFLLGAIGGVLLIASGLKSRKDHVPFGPFLAVGGVIALFWGPELWHMYKVTVGMVAL